MSTKESTNKTVKKDLESFFCQKKTRQKKGKKYLRIIKAREKKKCQNTKNTHIEHDVYTSRFFFSSSSSASRGLVCRVASRETDVGRELDQTSRERFQR